MVSSALRAGNKGGFLMTFEQLSYILAVAKCKNFTRAADECFISQSTLSTHINNLETELGIRIFDRTTRPVSVTPAGQAVVEFAQDIISKSQQLNSTLKKYSTFDSGSLLLGILPGSTHFRFLSSLKKYQEQYPLIHFDFHEGIASKLQSMLLNNDLDFAMISEQEVSPNINIFPYFSSEVVLIVPHDHELAGHTTVSPEELLTVTHITHKNSPLFAFCVDYMRRHLDGRNIEEHLNKYNMHNTYFRTDIAMVANGWGTMLITLDNALRYQSLGYSILHLDPPLERKFYFATSKSSQQLPIVQNFVSFICKEAQQWASAENSSK